MVATITLRQLLRAVAEMELEYGQAGVDWNQQETEAHYDRRNQLILRAISAAVFENVPVGIRIDPAEPEYPVVYFELPNGQVSWHLPQHSESWDGHDMGTKLARIWQWAR